MRNYIGSSLENTYIHDDDKNYLTMCCIGSKQSGKYTYGVHRAHGKNYVEQVDSGSQEAKSEQVMEVPAKLDGLKMTNHLKDLFADVTKREMTLNSVVTISGCAVVWKWKHNFEVFLAVHPICMSQLPQAIESARFNKYSILSHIMLISPCTVQYTSVVIQSLIFSVICSTLDCSSG
jgi:hypothetical protein